MTLECPKCYMEFNASATQTDVKHTCSTCKALLYIRIVDKNEKATLYEISIIEHMDYSNYADIE